MKGLVLNELITSKGREAAIAELVQMALDGTIPMPRTGKTINAREKFEAFKAFKPRYSSDVYKVFGDYGVNKLYRDPRDSKGPAGPARFRDGYLMVDDPDDVYARYNSFVDAFSEDARFKSRGAGGVSTLECWGSKECLTRVMTNLVNNNTGAVTSEALAASLFNIAGPPGLFRPTWIKGILGAIYGDDYSKPKRMLDISAGWGSELMVAMALGYDYLGFDPNPDLVQSHAEMIAQFGDRKKQRVIQKPFEHADLSKEKKFDVIVTSPPFYDKEVYTGGVQSIDVYGSFDAWITGFLFQSISNAWSALKVGGYMVIHMADYPGRVINDPMNLFIEQHIPGSSWEGCIGVSFKGNLAYPIWVWKKVTGQRKLWNPRRERSLHDMYPGIYNRVIGSYINSYASSITGYNDKVKSYEMVFDIALGNQPPSIVKFAKEVVFRDTSNLVLLNYYQDNPEEAAKFIKKIVLGLYQMKQ